MEAGGIKIGARGGSLSKAFVDRLCERRPAAIVSAQVADLIEVQNQRRFGVLARSASGAGFDVLFLNGSQAVLMLGLGPIAGRLWFRALHWTTDPTRTLAEPWGNTPTWHNASSTTAPQIPRGGQTTP